MIKHILTIGLFDKETHKQEIEKTEAIKTVIETIFNHGFCATVFSEGIYGIYTHEDGSRVIEPSLRVEIADIESDKILPLIHELGNAFNQESIMWETQNHPIAFTEIEYK